MRQPPTPFLWFDSCAEEAAEFYVSLFDDSRIVTVAHPTSSETASTVEFELGGRRFVAFDGGPAHQLNEAASLVVACEDQAELDHYWAQLTEGGQEGPCGWARDRFGLWWQVVPEDIGELMQGPGAERARAALMQMRKLDIAALRQAKAGS